MIFAALRLGHASSAFEKFPHVTCCQFGKRMSARLRARFDHVRSFPDLFDLVIARPGQEAKNYVLESNEANAHLHQIGMIGLRDIPAAVLIDRAHDCFSDGSVVTMICPFISTGFGQKG